MNNKNKKTETLSNMQAEVTVLSVDEMGRVITSGGNGFSYGLLLPQELYIGHSHVPIDSAISYTLSHYKKGNTFKAGIRGIVTNKHGVSIAILYSSIQIPKDIGYYFNKLKIGNTYKVIVNDILSDYFCLTIKGFPIIGYIEKSALDINQIKIGDALNLILAHKGENIFQYVHFTTFNLLNSRQTDSGINQSEIDIEKSFSLLFTKAEQSLLSEIDIKFVKHLLQIYPHVNRKDTFLDDLNGLYCSYDPELEISINSSYLTNLSYWVKYYRKEKTGEKCLLLYNSEDVVIRIILLNDLLVIKELYLGRTNPAARRLLQTNTDACLKLNVGKFHILNKFQTIPLGFSAENALKYIAEIQAFHKVIIRKLEKDLLIFRKDKAADFIILKEIIAFERDQENENSGAIVFVNKESNIERTTSFYYSSGVAFHFDLPSSDYSRLVNKETEDSVYVSITDEKGKPLRSGLLTYDTESHRACMEFPNKDNNVDANRIREGFYLKKRNATEHLKLQVEALSHFIQNKGTSFYDEMMSGSLPAPIITEEIDNIDFYDKKLQEAPKDNNQPLAVKRALGNQKVVLVQGPPGTGKTTVIVEIVRQLVKQGRKVLVCSQAHAAVDNIVEKLNEIPQEEQEILSMSIGNEGEEESWGEGFNPEDYRLFLNNNKLLVKHLTNGEPDADIQQLIENHFIYGNTIAKQYKESHEYILRHYANNPSLYECSESIVEKLLMESDKFSDNLLETCRYQTMDVILGTCIGIGMNKILKRGTIKFDTVIIDEAAKANLAESIVPLGLGERFVLVGDDKQLPPYSDPEIIEAYLKDVSRHTKEKLDYSDILKAVTTSLFQKIHESDSFPKECITMLNYQYRMHPEIGELISNVFYDGKVNMGHNTYMQQLSLPTPFDKQVTFIDTNRGDEKHGGHSPFERFESNSYCNDYEADIICEEIIPLLQKTINLREVSVGIITPYRAQRNLLCHSIKDVNFRNCVHTIDSIQGKEFDIVVFSFVRAFRASSNQKVGFLDDMRRLNVSLSRARKKLILVGHKATLVNPKFHIDQDIAGTKPYEVFKKLSVASWTYKQRTKADIFEEKYHVGDVIPCVVDSVADNTIYLVFKNDTNFCYSIPVSNKIEMEAIRSCTEVSIKFKRYNVNRKPQFEIISFVDGKGENHKVFSIESYTDEYPLGEEVLVTYMGKDEKGDIRVKHHGFQGKIPRSTYFPGALNDLNEGQIIRARVYYVDIEHQLISFCPILEENILPYILNGTIKNFCCKVVSKPSIGLIEFEFDGGFTAIFNIQPLWYNFLEIGKSYASIGYDTNKSCAIIRRDRYFKPFVAKHAIEDEITGKIVHVGRNSIAIADNFPGYIKIGDCSCFKDGDSCKLIVYEINKEQYYVNFKLA